MVGNSKNGVREPTERLGVAPAQTHPALQTEVYKELINKLAWVLGSTYRRPYSSARSPSRTYAVKMAQAILRDHGYPVKIALSAEAAD